jgi:hypothetical protein
LLEKACTGSGNGDPTDVTIDGGSAWHASSAELVSFRGRSMARSQKVLDRKKPC